MDVKCRVCGKGDSFRCSNCHQVSYCSKEHQKQDWKKHKHDCRPLLVKEDKTLGRHLVATRRIKEGEIISKERPLVIGPSQITPPVCLGCYKQLTASTSVPCELCGWPVCNVSCQNSPNHKPECEITVARGQKISITTFGQTHPNYQSITALRCLWMKKNRPDVWNKLMKLESHCEERKGTEKWQVDHAQIATFARKFFKLEDQFSEDEMMKVCGIVQVNAHEVPFTEPSFIAVYDMTSMIEHNCRANCAKSFTDHGEVLIAAAADIKAGENLSICYTDPLWGTMTRLNYLQETKFFGCKCDRCADASEMGTMFSAVRCRKEGCKGIVLPKSFIHSDVIKDEHTLPDWYCGQCSDVVSSTSVQKLLLHIGRDLDAMQKGDANSCIKFLDHYSKYLHESHYYMVDVKLALTHLIGQEEGGLPALTDERLQMKVDLSKQVAELLEKLAPAEVRARGLLLFELHAAMAEIGRRRAESSGEGPGVMIHFLNESKKHLTNSIKLLQHEPKEMPEGKILEQANKNLIDMDKLLLNLYQTLDTPM